MFIQIKSGVILFHKPNTNSFLIYTHIFNLKDNGIFTKKKIVFSFNCNLKLKNNLLIIK